MNHQPFEDWLLADEALTARQKRELQEHLKACGKCASLAEVNLALGSVRAVVPAEGFAGRFQVRLAARKQSIRRRNFWGFLILVLSALSVAFWLSLPVINLVVQSPVDMLGSWLANLFSLWASLQAMSQVGTVLLRVVPDFIPDFVWPVLLLAGSGWCLVWVFSLMKLSKNMQGV